MIKTHKDWFKRLAVVSLAATSGAVWAANDGSRGTTSTGDTTVSASIPLRVQITDIADFAFGEWSGTGDLSGTDEICVWSTTRNYKLTATGDMSGTAFGMTSATTTDTVAFTVDWQTDGTAPTTGLVSGTTYTTLAANSNSTSCAGANAAHKAVMTVTVPEANLAAARAATDYTGVVTLVVEAE